MTKAVATPWWSSAGFATRAIPAIVDRLKNDHSKGTSAWPPRRRAWRHRRPGASIYLERCVIYEKKQEVRDAATLALSRMPGSRRPLPSRRRSNRPRRSAAANPGELAELRDEIDRRVNRRDVGIGRTAFPIPARCASE